MQEYHSFIEEVWEYYAKHARVMPWRVPDQKGGFDPYKIMVSEVMLQQTQVGRVIPKYGTFIDQFPTVERLAQAELADVLQVWSGLGYNRRAKYLHQAAKQVMKERGGVFPQTVDELTQLQGIGKNTAAAIRVYAWNKPAVFIETNIRTVYIHHFFNDQSGISDKDVYMLVEATLDHENPREWYWALMDYGTFIKQTVGNVSRNSQHYTKQSKFEGSRRQIRGIVIKALLATPQTLTQLQGLTNDDRLAMVLDDLIKEKLIQKRGDNYLIIKQ